MGKLDLIKGQPAYLADKSNKRKEPHESDQGENTTQHVEKVKKPRKPRKSRNITAMHIDPSQQWRVFAPQSHVSPLTWRITTVPALAPAVDPTTTASGSNGPGPSFPTNPPLRPPKKAKISTFSTIASTGDGMCPLCGGPRHKLSDCLAPKGGVEK